jgi:hypothetical protein
MQCKELEAVLELEGLNPLPQEASDHLAACSDCQNFLADLSAVVVAAKSIPAEVAPPDRIWISIRAQLESEGIIRDSEPIVVPADAPWWQSFAELFRPRVLATVGTLLFVVLGSVYFMEHRGASNTAKVEQPAPTQVIQAPTPVAPSQLPASPVVVAKHSQQETQSPQRAITPQQPRPSDTVLRPSPSEDAYLGDSAAVLSQTEDALPHRELSNNAAVDASLRQNLRTINEFIAECQSRLKQNPQDQLTREYLNTAYQQKAELLTAMMDSGRSEH